MRESSPDLIQTSIKENLPFACWRLPDDPQIYFGAGEEKQFELSDLKAQKNLFLIQEFLPQAKARGIELEQSCSRNLAEFPEYEFTVGDSEQSDYIGQEKQDFIQAVEKGISEIRSAAVEKIVLSRSSKTVLPASFNLFTFFKSLCRAYPKAFVSLIHLPGTGTWIGASPELLLKGTSSTLESAAVAGTRDSERDWSDKEFREQKIVSDVIKKQFADLGLKLEAKEQEELKAGPITHLMSSFRSENNGDPVSPLQQLHPSPAVAGFPKKQSIELIQKLEKHQRRFYSGFLGHWTDAYDFSFYVNLRCMRVLKKEAILYAGAGIMEDSDPESEWVETKRKMNILLSLLH